MSLSGRQIVIAGAGIIGLTTALELADAGAQVTVLECGHAMQQSSWAAAGMLAVDDPENDLALHALAVYSRSLYPGFLARIEQLTGIAVPLRTTITLQGHAGPSLLSELLPDLLPGLRTDRYYFERLEEASLDPRDLCAALPAAVRAAGVSLTEETGVKQVTREGARLRIATRTDALDADHFVLAAGAWSAQIALPWNPERPLPVAPRKGQMLEVTLDSADLPVVLRTPLLYLVPRGDGRVAIGATVEHAEFDRSIDETAGNRLWQAAGELWPPVLRGRITARWTGLRPGFQAGVTDALPVIGRLRGSVDDNLWAATGHFRNGILLAPATARVLREIMDGASPSVPLESFDPGRFA